MRERLHEAVVDVNPEMYTPEDYSGADAFDRMPPTCGDVDNAFDHFAIDFEMYLLAMGLSERVTSEIMTAHKRMSREAEKRIKDKVTYPFRKVLVLTTREREQARAATKYWKRKAAIK